MNKTLDEARSFIYRNARPIDIARWRYHFENGNKSDVLKALSYYQNEDGGFGHALEPDSWNPNSSPIQTWVATEILHEINFVDNNHPIIKNILRYLKSGKHYNEGFWSNTLKSNNDYPHAPWWHTDSESICHNVYNPTACLAGFIVRFADKNSELYTLGCQIVINAYESYLSQNLLNDMHTILCYIRMMQYVEESNADSIIDLPTLKEKLIVQVRSSITQDITKWETSYICKPSMFIDSKESVFYIDNMDISKYECDFIVKTQLAGGSWNIPWGWNGYPEEWPISKNWWKSYVAIHNMLYLKRIRS